MRFCRGDKMKPICYVTNIWQVLCFLARGPWRVCRRMVLQKMLKILGNYVIFIRDIGSITGNVGECPATSQATIMFPAWRGPSTLCALDVREYLNNVFPNLWIGRGGPVQWPPCSPSYGFLYLGEMKCLMYETPIDTPEELVARVAKAAAIICETQSIALRYQLCINVNRRYFEQLL